MALGYFTPLLHSAMGFVTSALILGLAAAHAQRRLQTPTAPNPCATMALGCQEPMQTSNCSERKTSWCLGRGTRWDTSNAFQLITQV